MADKTRVLEDCALMIETVCDCTELDAEIEVLTEELKVVSELVSQCVNENARKKQSQEAYAKKYNSLVRRYEKAEKRLNATMSERTERINKKREIQIFIEALRNKPESIDRFDEELWTTLVEKVEVSHDKKCMIFFKNGDSASINF
jgi:predicted RNase H-like nuclease (RuvC/YqgF family)